MKYLLRHVNGKASTAHCKTGVCELSSDVIAAMGLLQCAHCTWVYPSGDAHSCREATLAGTHEYRQLTERVNQALKNLTRSDFCFDPDNCLHDVTLDDIMSRRTTTFARAPNSNVIKRALVGIYNSLAMQMSSETDGSIVALKIFLLLGRLIHVSNVGRVTSARHVEIVGERVVQLLEGKVATLLTAANTPFQPGTQPTDAVMTDERRRKAANKAAAAGNFKSAVQMLQPLPPQPIAQRPDVQEALQKVLLQEPPTDDIQLGHIAEDQLLRPKTVLMAIKTANKRKAAGPTGDRVDYYQDLLSFDVHLPITKILNLLLLKKLPTSFLSAVNGTLLSKATGGIRPIGVPEAITRILGRSILFTEQHNFDNTLQPYQFGVSIKNATHSVATTVNILRALCPDDVTLAIDTANAYGSVSRVAIARALQEHALHSPLTKAYFNAVYTRPTKSLLQGDIFYYSRGVVQGDPMAPLLFCLAIASQLRISASLMPDGHIFAYIDDVTLVGPVDQVATAYRGLQASLATVGLMFNEKKTTLLPHTDSVDTSALPFSPNHDGIMILGVPIGHDAFIRQQTMLAAEKARLTADLIMEGMASKQLQLLLLRACILPRLTHLARTCPPSLIVDAAQLVTTTLAKCIRNILQHPLLPDPQLTDTTSMQMMLPLHTGGLGFPDLAETAVFTFPAAVLESMSLMVRLNNNLEPAFALVPTSQTNFTNAFCLALDRVNTIAQLSGCVGSVPSVTDIIYPQRKLQATFTAFFYERIMQSMRSTLHDVATAVPVDAHARQLARLDLLRLDAVSALGASAFLAAIPSSKYLTLDNSEMCISLRRYLGINLCTPAVIAMTCICGDACTEAHVQTCTRSYEISRRHNSVRDGVAAMMKSANITVKVEPMVGINNLRWDISAANARGGKDFYDITVTMPLQTKYARQQKIPAHTQALDDAKEFKLRKYSPSLALQPKDSTFTPLVFNSYGAQHMDVSNLISHLASRAGRAPPPQSTWASADFASFWAQVFSVAIYKGTAKAVITAIERATNLLNMAGGVQPSMLQ